MNTILIVLKYLCDYRIIPNKRTLCEGNGLEMHNLETELILPVFIPAYKITKTLKGYISARKGDKD